MTIQDTSIHTDRFTGPGRPALVIDHEGVGWSAVPHGVLTPGEKVFGPMKEEPEGTHTDHTVRLQRQNPNAVLIRRLTPLGAETLGQQLIDAAQEARVGLVAPDAPELEDYVTAGQLSKQIQVDRELAESITIPGGTFDDGVPLTTTPDGEVRERTWLAQSHYFQTLVGRVIGAIGGKDWLDGPTDRAGAARDVVNVLREILTTDGQLDGNPVEDPAVTALLELRRTIQELPDDKYLRGLTLKAFGEKLVEISNSRVGDRIAAMKMRLSDPADDAAQPELGRLIVMAEGYTERQGEGQIVLTCQPTASESEPIEWMVAMTFGREDEDSDMAGGAAYGTGVSAAQALRQALHECGEKV